jgi:hypothetical protein
LLLRPKIGEILEAIETRELEETLGSREEALDFVKSEYSLGAKNQTKARFSLPLSSSRVRNNSVAHGCRPYREQRFWSP